MTAAEHLAESERLVALAVDGDGNPSYGVTPASNRDRFRDLVDLAAVHAALANAAANGA